MFTRKDDDGSIHDIYVGPTINGKLIVFKDVKFTNCSEIQYRKGTDEVIYKVDKGVVLIDIRQEHEIL